MKKAIVHSFIPHRKNTRKWQDTMRQNKLMCTSFPSHVHCTAFGHPVELIQWHTCFICIRFLGEHYDFQVTHTFNELCKCVSHKVTVCVWQCWCTAGTRELVQTKYKIRSVNFCPFPLGHPPPGCTLWLLHCCRVQWHEQLFDFCLKGVSVAARTRPWRVLLLHCVHFLLFNPLCSSIGGRHYLSTHI